MDRFSIATESEYDTQERGFGGIAMPCQEDSYRLDMYCWCPKCGQEVCECPQPCPLVPEFKCRHTHDCEGPCWKEEEEE